MSRLVFLPSLFNKPISFVFEDLFVHFKVSYRAREGETDFPYIGLVPRWPQQSVLGQVEDPGASFVSPKWLAGTKVFGPSSVAFPSN